uniref:Putative secreted protein n=1 Tax=Ixodes ricinus TaxID=34613 RepID=A0A6B0UGR4_IXORI
MPSGFSAARFCGPFFGGQRGFFIYFCWLGHRCFAVVLFAVIGADDLAVPMRNVVTLCGEISSNNNWYGNKSLILSVMRLSPSNFEKSFSCFALSFFLVQGVI